MQHEQLMTESQVLGLQGSTGTQSVVQERSGSHLAIIGYETGWQTQSKIRRRASKRVKTVQNSDGGSSVVRRLPAHSSAFSNRMLRLFVTTDAFEGNRGRVSD